MVRRTLRFEPLMNAAIIFGRGEGNKVAFGWQLDANCRHLPWKFSAVRTLLLQCRGDEKPKRMIRKPRVHESVATVT